MGRLKVFLNAWGPALLWMALIFYLSAQSQLPTVPESWLDTLLKKSAHFLVYAVLARLYLRALGFYRPLPLPAAGLALLLAALYAVTDEFHQAFTPGRTPRLTDWIIDCAGAAAGLFRVGLPRRRGGEAVSRARPPGNLP
ncbi:MAG: hypothetical protein C4315_10755 [Chloroflexota bacterium]